MVDWSTFWNDIFPGLVLILSSSAAAYWLVHKYQRKKYLKELKDDLINQEHRLLAKFYRWIEVSNKMLNFSKLYYSERINKRLEMEDRMLELENMIEEEYKNLSVPAVIRNVKELLESIIERSESVIDLISIHELISKLMSVFLEILLDVELLNKRLQIQLGLTKESLGFFNDFTENISTLTSELIAKSEREEIDEKSRSKEFDKLKEFFEKVGDIILSKKHRFKRFRRNKDLNSKD